VYISLEYVVTGSAKHEVHSGINRACEPALKYTAMLLRMACRIKKERSTEACVTSSATEYTGKRYQTATNCDVLDATNTCST
jgi:hypothetical protein